MKKQKNSIDIDTVMHVARLARINLTKKEAEKYRQELNEILKAFRDLEKIKTNAKQKKTILDSSNCGLAGVCFNCWSF